MPDPGWNHTAWSVFTAIGFVSGVVVVIGLGAQNSIAAYIATAGLLFASVQFWRNSKPR